MKNLFKNFYKLALTENHLWKTNTYQIGFNNFHFVLTRSTDLSLFLQILATILRKKCVREKINANWGLEKNHVTENFVLQEFVL